MSGFYKMQVLVGPMVSLNTCSIQNKQIQDGMRPVFVSVVCVIQAVARICDM